MKTSRIILATFLLAAAVSPLCAQEKIENLFQRMASDPKVKVETDIQMDRNPKSKKQNEASICKIHNFYIPKANKKGRYAKRQEDYVTDLARAIETEASNPNCYRIANYNAGAQNSPRQYNIIYGEDATQYITIGSSRYKNYILACFLDKENAKYRWCYALEWWKQGSGPIYGKYMVFYSKIPTENKSPSQKDDKKKNNASMYFLANFNTLWTRWMNGEYKTDATLPVAVYTNIKEAVEEKILTTDEKELVKSALLQMMENVVGVGKDRKGTISYLNLAYKLL